MRRDTASELKFLTLILTSDCNLACDYCYQTRGAAYMDANVAVQAIDSFLENSRPRARIDFYGGEPLMAFPLMQRVMEYSSEKASSMDKKVSYGFTTNGMLLGRDVFDVLSRFEGHLGVSLDGSPEIHTLGRGPHSWPNVRLIQEFGRRNKQWSMWINAVVTPSNVGHVSQSVRFLHALNLGRIHLSYQYEGNWRDEHYRTLARQFDELAEWGMDVYSRRREGLIDALKRTIPGKQPFACTAGQDRFAVMPDGSIYGCFPLAPLSRRAAESGTELCLGTVDDLRKPWQEGLGREVRHFRQTDYHAASQDCCTCRDLLLCAVCPGVGLSAHGDPFTAPESVCRISRIRWRASERVFATLTARDGSHLWNLVQ